MIPFSEAEHSFEASSKITVPIAATTALQGFAPVTASIETKALKQKPSRPVCGKQDVTTNVIKQRLSSTISLLLNNV